MKTKLALAVFILTATIMPAAWAGDNVIISEVLYDPAGTETGGEAVELYNPTDNAVDLSRWKIATESSSSDATIPDGTVLGARSFYLIADSGWSTLRDDLNWSEADHEEALTMSNTDAGVALVAANGTTLDAVGWGDSTGIDAGLFEGTPATDVSEGSSLRRAEESSDTDDNSVDFTESVPDLQNSSSAGGIEGENSSTTIEIGVDVENNPPVINSVSILDDEDPGSEGVQVMPVPEGTKNVVVSADVTDVDGVPPDITAQITGPDTMTQAVMVKVMDINATSARYNATLPMEFYDSAGVYDVVVTVGEGQTNVSSNASFEYLSMTAISIDANSLRFTGARLGGTSTINGDFALSTIDTPTVRNTGNTPLDIGLYGTDLVDGENIIGVDNLKYSFDNDFGSAFAGTLSSSMQIQNLGLANSEDSVTSLGFQLYVPSTTPNGNYTADISIVAVSSS